jgi:hypothetical protein
MRQTSFLYHMSGRQRFEIVDNGKWTEKPFIHLAVIGKNLDIPNLNFLLNTVIEKNINSNEKEFESNNNNNMIIQVNNFEEMIRSDNRFEYSKTIEKDRIVVFRLTGYTTYGMTKEKSQLHGINFNEVNHYFLKSFNSNSGRWFISGSLGEDNQFWLHYSKVCTSYFSVL